MMKRIACLALLATLAAAQPFVDWRAEVASYFGEEKAADYKGALDFLTGKIDSLSDEDKPVASGMLAFLYGQIGDREREYQKLGEYFEKYGAAGMGYSFLSLSARNDIFRYLRDWQLRYPWVLKIGLVAPGGPAPTSPASNPPETILLGVEMAGDVYYKLFDGSEILKGGQLHRGFNTVPLQARKLFREPAAFPYVLEFKSGDLIIRRELIIGIQMDYLGLMGEPTAGVGANEYILEMFFGQELLASSRKTLVSLNKMGVEVPPPSGKFDPFGPGYQNQPRTPNAVPIMAVPAAILEAIKSLKKRDEVEPVPPVELKTEILVPFTRLRAGGDIVEVRARVSLGLQGMRFLSYSQVSPPVRTNRP
jgi:hypothetical protein